MSDVIAKHIPPPISKFLVHPAPYLEQLLSKLPQIVLLLLQHSLFTSFLSIFVQRYDAFLNFKTGVSVPDDDHIILVSSTYLSHPWGCHVFASILTSMTFEKSEKLHYRTKPSMFLQESRRIEPFFVKKPGTPVGAKSKKTFSVPPYGLWSKIGKFVSA